MFLLSPHGLKREDLIREEINNTYDTLKLNERVGRW